MDQGWSGYYDAGTDEAMSGIVYEGMGSLGALGYTPDLSPVGSKSTYWPRSVDADADALTYVGYEAGSPGGGVSQAADMQNATGAWDTQFRAAVTKFQADNGLTVDGWIGPQTRTTLAARVAQKNAQPSPLPAPQRPLDVPIPPPSPSNQVPVPTPITPGKPVPAAVSSLGMSTNTKIAIGVGAAVALGALYFVLK